jgi:hypothetical protein
MWSINRSILAFLYSENWDHFNHNAFSGTENWDHFNHNAFSGTENTLAAYQ